MRLAVIFAELLCTAMPSGTVTRGQLARKMGCWDKEFTKKRCCNPERGPRGDPACWDNFSQLTWEICCTNDDEDDDDGEFLLVRSCPILPGGKFEATIDACFDPGGVWGWLLAAQTFNVGSYLYQSRCLQLTE